MLAIIYLLIDISTQTMHDNKEEVARLRASVLQLSETLGDLSSGEESFPVSLRINLTNLLECVYFFYCTVFFMDAEVYS